MKKILYLVLFGTMLMSCKKEKDHSEVSEKQAVVNDTILNEYSSTEHKDILKKKDTLIKINNEKFTLRCTAKIEPNQSFEIKDAYSDKGKNYKDVYKGINATYTVSLIDASGKVKFIQTLTKDSFKNILTGDILAQTDTYLPDYIGYVKKFNSFLFTLDFFVPDSDVGAQCFFMINTKGELVENLLNNYYGGGDCDGKIEIPTHEKFIVTCQNMIFENGKKIDLSDKRFLQVGTKLINDNTILVIQDHNDSTNVQNARLIDGLGKILKSFTYKGHYDVLGFEVPLYIDKLNHNYVLLDEEQQELRVINKKHPLSTYTSGFFKMKPFNNDKLVHEIVFDLDTEFSKNTFAMDTLTKTFRHRKNE